MTEAYNIPGVLNAPEPTVDTMPAGPGIWAGEPHDPMPHFPAPDLPMPGLPIDRAAVVEWMHDMVEARLPEGFPLPWDHGGPCNDPGPVVMPL
jgi:hypothetical protein